jgi:hypothetical protein
MKAYGGSRGLPPLILSVGTRLSEWSGFRLDFTARKRTSVTHWIDWALQAVWTLRRREKSEILPAFDHSLFQVPAQSLLLLSYPGSPY